MTRTSILRSRKASQARATLAGLVIAAVLMAASPISAHAWSSGTDSAEMADEIAALLGRAARCLDSLPQYAQSSLFATAREQVTRALAGTAPYGELSDLPDLAMVPR
jgi:hypothetical protein